MRRRFHRLCCALAAASLAHAAHAHSGPDLWSGDLGQPEWTAFVGNGGLTAGFDLAGQLVECRWPSPGYWNQIAYPARPPLAPEATRAGRGAHWIVATDDGDFPVTLDAWRPETPPEALPAGAAARSVARLESEGIAVQQVAFVHYERPILAVRLKVLEAPGPLRVHWRQNFSPCTRHVPELPFADWLLPQTNGFAAFSARLSDSGLPVVYQFRPRAPGRAEWARARDFLAANAPPAAWDVFDDGVWIAAASHEASSAQCALDGAAPASPELLSTAAVGGAHALLSFTGELAPGGDTVTVFLAFGKNRREADEQLRFALETGAEALRRQTESHWSRWLYEHAMTETAPRPIPGDTLRRTLMTLAINRDAKTGAIVRAPIAQPPLALDWTRDGAWMQLALDEAGLHDWAGDHLRFHAAAIRRAGRRGMPAGSLPAALYTDGAPGVPNVLLETRSAALFLSAVYRHAQMLPPSHAAAFLDGMAAPAALTAAFLLGWTEGDSAKPYFSYQPESGRDGRPEAALLIAMLGLESALRIAELRKQPTDPEWLGRADELKAQIGFHLLHDPAPWRVPLLLACWLNHGLGEEPNPRAWRVWDIPVATDNGPRPLREITLETLPLDPAPPIPDALHAALLYLAARAGNPAALL